VITSLDHIHFHAADPESTQRFYEEVFGAERLGTLPNKAGTGNHFMILGGQVLVVSAFPPGMEAHPPPEVAEGALRAGFGVAHFGLQTSDLEAMVTRLEQRGVQVHDAPVTAGPIRYVYLSAPDGVVIELVELVLPRKLRFVRPFFGAYNWLVHVSKRAFARQLFKKKVRA